MFNFQFGSFNESSPNWFDWFNLFVSSIITILSIFGGYHIAKRIYNTEKKDKIQEDSELRFSEVELFKNSLIQLNNSIILQIENLKAHLEKTNFSIIFNQGIHSEFMNQINLKYLYKDVGLNNKKSIEDFNKLLANLYALSDFRNNLRDQLRTFSAKYNFHEDKFYKYRKLVYTKYYELCNQRNTSVLLTENGLKKWSFNDDDNFMLDYTSLLKKTYDNNSIIDESGLKSRELLTSEFIVPLIKISSKYIPEDYNAIEVNDIANEVNSAYLDMEETMKSHFQVINSYIEVLNNIHNKINLYLN